MTSRRLSEPTVRGLAPVLVAFLLSAFLSLPTPAQAIPPVLVRGPYLQLATPTAMSVRWRTDLLVDSELRYGPTPGDLSTAITLAGARTEHEIPVSGLSSATRYYYSVGTTAEVLAGGDADHFFETPPLPGTVQPVRIWVIGDSGRLNVRSIGVRDAYLGFAAATGKKADLFLMLGDNAYLNGTDAEYTNTHFATYPTIHRNTVLWPTLGNHDCDSSTPATQTGPYFDAFTLPAAGEAGGVPSGTETHYSFDAMNLHIVSIEVNRSALSVGGALYQWVDADLAANDRDWTIVFMHYPPYSAGGHNSETDLRMTQIRENFNPLFESHGVDVVLGAHSHSYERSMLIDGHYGLSATFGPEHVVDGGDGDPLGDGAYLKPGPGPVPNAGTVYAVVGSSMSARPKAGSLDHPVMVTSVGLLGDGQEGSLVLDVVGLRLDGTWIQQDGQILDRFRIVKGPWGSVPALPPLSVVVLAILLLGAAGRAFAMPAAPFRKTQKHFGSSGT